MAQLFWCLFRDHSGPQNGRRDFSSRGPAQELPAAAEALPGPPPLPAAPPKKKVLSAAVVVGSSLAEVSPFSGTPESEPYLSPGQVCVRLVSSPLQEDAYCLGLTVLGWNAKPSILNVVAVYSKGVYVSLGLSPYNMHNSNAMTGHARLLQDAELPEAPEEPPALKRPRDDSEENPAMKKRNKRMFGALLGTLQRFK